MSKNNKKNEIQDLEDGCMDNGFLGFFCVKKKPTKPLSPLPRQNISLNDGPLTSYQTSTPSKL